MQCCKCKKKPEGNWNVLFVWKYPRKKIMFSPVGNITWFVWNAPNTHCGNAQFAGKTSGKLVYRGTVWLKNLFHNWFSSIAKSANVKRFDVFGSFVLVFNFVLFLHFFFERTNKNIGVAQSFNSQSRNWVDEGEIISKNWSCKNPLMTDWRIEEKQKLFDQWRDESRWRIT
jgi:hypothetical protein